MNATVVIDNADPIEHVVEVESDPDVVVKKKLDPGLRRNLKVIGIFLACVIGLLVLLYVWRAATTEKKSAPVATSLRQSTIAGNEREQMSPAMRDALQAKQLDEQKKAADKGDLVFIPKDTLAAPVSLTAPKQPVSNGNGEFLQSPPAAQVAQQGPAPESARDVRRHAGLEIQLRQMLDSTGDLGGAAPQRITFDNKLAKAPIGGTAAGASLAASASSIAVAKGPSIAEGLEIMPAETASPVDTYRTKYASARIVAGKLSGAFLVGKSELVEEGLSTHYTMMRFNGKTYPIDALALDEKTSTDAMNADIDHRYLQRYVMPIGAAVVGGAATALAQTGSTVVATAGGVLGASPPATAAQAGYAGLGAGVAILQREVDKAAQRPLQATLPAGTPIGIMFLTPVEASTAK